jgi:hypothetical protein
MKFSSKKFLNFYNGHYHPVRFNALCKVTR